MKSEPKGTGLQVMLSEVVRREAQPGADEPLNESPL
jgi:hypothetical protein